MTKTHTVYKTSGHVEGRGLSAVDAMAAILSYDGYAFEIRPMFDRPKEGGFAQECFDKKTVEDLRAAATLSQPSEADEVDMEAWGIDDSDDWRRAIVEALAAKTTVVGYDLWHSDGSANSTRSTRHMRKTAVFSLKTDIEVAVAEIAAKVIAAHWPGMPEAMFDADYDKMMTEANGTA